MRLKQYLLTEKVTKQELFELKQYANKLFKSLGLTVQWTNHMATRLAGRDADITKEELVRLFKETFRRYGKKINNLNVDAQRVIKDMKTNINMPFVIGWRPQTGFNLFVKTVIRKKDFKTANPVFIIDQLESYEKDLQKLNEEYNPDLYPDSKVRSWVQELERELQLIDKDLNMYKNKETPKKIRTLLHKVWRELQNFYKIVGRSKTREKNWRHTK